MNDPVSFAKAEKPTLGVPNTSTNFTPSTTATTNPMTTDISLRARLESSMRFLSTLLQCPTCGHTAHEPVRLRCCGGTICAACVSTTIESAPSQLDVRPCPLCRAPNSVGALLRLRRDVFVHDIVQWAQHTRRTVLGDSDSDVASDWEDDDDDDDEGDERYHFESARDESTDGFIEESPPRLLNPSKLLQLRDRFARLRTSYSAARRDRQRQRHR